MNLRFSYNIEKELDNLKMVLKSRNHPNEILEIAEEIKNANINIHDDTQLLKFFNEQTANLDIDSYIFQITKKWYQIQSEVIHRFEKIFKATIDFGTINVYLTINKRCGYNYSKKKYFFVYYKTKYTNYIIIHELLHLYTYELLLPMFERSAISYKEFQDYKEALTFLLNFEFHDLIDGYIDQGYQKQENLRKRLIESWNGDLYELTSSVIASFQGNMKDTKNS